MAATAIGVLGVAINEILKTQGITSDEQSMILDPFGYHIENFVKAIPKISDWYHGKRTPREETQEEADRREFIKYHRTLGDIAKKQRFEDATWLSNEYKRLEAEEKERIRLRTPAQSVALNKTYQSAVNRAIANPLQTSVKAPVIRRTTEQQVSDKELQQKIQNLKAQLQPAVAPRASRRPLPPSVPLKGKGLLNRVMADFNMDKKEAKKYIKKHGSN